MSLYYMVCSLSVVFSRIVEKEKKKNKPNQNWVDSNKTRWYGGKRAKK